MNELNLAQMRILAEDLAEQASQWLRRAGRVGDVTLKADLSVVTSADRAIQRLIVDRLASECPDHAIVGEEDQAGSSRGPGRSEARHCWVIDPLDGTRNYTVGFPCFATSIALLEGGVPVVGVVREHNTGLTYSAVAGDGTTLDGQTIHVCGQSVDGDRIIAFPSTKDDLTVRVLRLWVARPGLVCRNMGSTALHLALVASGAVEAAYARRCKIWDIAAGALLVIAAGGVVTRLDGSPLFPWSDDADPGENIPTLAGTPFLHGELLRDFSITPTG